MKKRTLLSLGLTLGVACSDPHLTQVDCTESEEAALNLAAEVAISNPDIESYEGNYHPKVNSDRWGVRNKLRHVLFDAGGLECGIPDMEAHGTEAEASVDLLAPTGKQAIRVNVSEPGNLSNLAKSIDEDADVTELFTELYMEGHKPKELVNILIDEHHMSYEDLIRMMWVVQQIFGLVSAFDHESAHLYLDSEGVHPDIERHISLSNKPKRCRVERVYAAGDARNDANHIYELEMRKAIAERFPDEISQANLEFELEVKQKHSSKCIEEGGLEL